MLSWNSKSIYHIEFKFCCFHQIINKKIKYNYTINSFNIIYMNNSIKLTFKYNKYNLYIYMLNIVLNYYYINIHCVLLLKIIILKLSNFYYQMKILMLIANPFYFIIKHDSQLIHFMMAINPNLIKLICEILLD